MSYTRDGLEIELGGEILNFYPDDLFDVDDNGFFDATKLNIEFLEDSIRLMRRGQVEMSRDSDPELFPVNLVERFYVPSADVARTERWHNALVIFETACRDIEIANMMTGESDTELNYKIVALDYVNRLNALVDGYGSDFKSELYDIQKQDL